MLDEKYQLHSKSKTSYTLKITVQNENGFWIIENIKFSVLLLIKMLTFAIPLYWKYITYGEQPASMPTSDRPSKFILKAEASCWKKSPYLQI